MIILNNLTKLLANSQSSIANNQSVGYNFINKHKTYQNYKLGIFKLLKYFFARYYGLISKPFWTITPDKIIIHLCLYQPQNLLKNKNKNKFKKKNKYRRFRFRNRFRLSQATIKKLYIPRSKFRSLILILSEILQTNVELDIVELRYPYHDSHILAQFLGLNTKKYNFYKLIKKLFQRAKIFKRNIISNSVMSKKRLNKVVPVKLTGIKIKIAGRLTTQRVVPKSTVKSAYKGCLEKSKQSFVDTSSFTAKNKLGAYTITVWLSHKIV